MHSFDVRMVIGALMGVDLDTEDRYIMTIPLEIIRAS